MTCYQRTLPLMRGLIGVYTNMYTGFADLKSPADILAKMKHDFARIEKDPMDTYAAFDFFVTAEQILDWIHPDKNKDKERKLRKRIKASNPLMTLISHIANGIKHFHVQDLNLKSVKNIEKNEGGFDHNAVDSDSFGAGAFSFAGLVVETADGDFEHVNSIAKRVVKHWENELANP